MSRSSRIVAWAAGGAIAVIGCSAPTGAQTTSSDGWRFGVTPYGWLSGLSGTIGVGPVTSRVDLSAGDVLDMLHFGIMGAAEARKGPWVIAADGIYASLGAGKVFAVRGDTGSLELSQHETIIQPVGGYSLGDETWGLDLLAGFRYWNLSTTLDVDRTRRPSNERSGSRQWVDATGGLRFRTIPYEKVRFVAGADGGGGGARDTWQLYSSLGYDAWSRWTLGIAYRALHVNYDRDNFLFDTRTEGIILGVTYRP